MLMGMTEKHGLLLRAKEGDPDAGTVFCCST